MGQVYVQDHEDGQAHRFANFMVGLLIGLIRVIIGIVIAMNVVVRWIQIDTTPVDSYPGIPINE